MIDFFVTNFAPGSGGKFVSTMIQASNEVAHWSIKVNRAKNTNKFNEVFLIYVKESFPINFDNHLKQEPCLPFVFNEFSSFPYKRNNLNKTQIEEILAKELYIQEITKQNQKLMLVIHKPLSDFLHNADSVTLCIDSKRAKRFAQRSLLNKHFKISDNYVLYKKHHPDYCNVASITMAKKYFYENQPYKNISLRQFLKQEILNPALFKNYENLSGKGVISVNSMITNKDIATNE